MKVYQAIANEIDRINMGQINAEEALEELIHEFLPSGSGFDAEITVEYNTNKQFCNKYILIVPYHCMDENGFYDDWVELKFTISPSFKDYDIKENWQGYRGKYKEILKDYIFDSITYGLDQTVKNRWELTEMRNYYVKVD